MEMEGLRQIAVLGGEATIVAALLAAMFHLRKSLGLAPMHATLGVFYQVATLLAGTIYVQITDSLLMSPGSSILFPASLFAVLLIYIREDWPEARRAIYALVAANLVVGLLCLVLSQHLKSSLALNPLGMPAELFEQQPRLLLVATLGFLADAVLIIVTYDRLGRVFQRALFSRIFVAMSLVLAFDTVIFVGGGFYDSPHVRSLFVSAVAGKIAFAALYAAILSMYLRFPDASDAGRASDMLPSLSYRERYEELQRRSLRDSLTGLYHRGFFDAMLASQLPVAVRSGSPLTLLVVDVDHFKKINDDFGHREGDAVLRKVAEAIESVVRASDFACRFGGEEFAILLPATDAAAGLAVAERMRVAVTSFCRAQTAAGSNRPVTVSIGLAAAPRDASSVEVLFETADRRLYDAKRSGRDCIRHHCATQRDARGPDPHPAMGEIAAVASA